jgi:diguanylate cyclase (GGDEF)-like protein/PAS domain S-box-containing protein
VSLLATGALVAGLVHAGVCPEHFREATVLGVFFLVVSTLQLAWAAAVLTRASRALLLVGAAGNAAVVGVWVLSRTVGVPVGPERWQPEAVGVIDAFAVGVGAAVAVGAVLLARLMFVGRSSTQRTSRPTRRSRLWRWLPHGSTLPEDVWAQRHRGILVLLWLHVPGVFLFSLARHVPVLEAALEGCAVAAFALAAMTLRNHRRPTTIVAAMGLLTCSALLVYESGGVIEMHFHYFVVVGVITLYQDWWPFLAAIGYVVLQHGVLGVIDPVAVYNHQSAIDHPWQWAGIHGLFVLGMSAAGIASWRLNEALLRGVTERQEQLSEAQHVAQLGSWERDLATGIAVWSDEFYRLLGLDNHLEASPEAFLSQVHPEDLTMVTDGLAQARQGQGDFASDFRITRDDDGATRWLQGRATITSFVNGVPAVLAGTLQDITDRKQAEFDLREAMSLLNATLDATADGILVVDGHGVITSFNRRFVELWHIPEDVLASRDDNEALGYVLSQLAEPDAFLAKVRELYAHPDSDSQDELAFLDGRVFERFSTPQRVGGRIAGRVWSFRDVTQQKRLEGELAHQAFHDPLTNLANQALFRDRVQHALARSARHGPSVAVLFVDLDDFKTVNDSLGHTVGDALLVAVGERLRGCLRITDTAARLGGDEFAILIEDITDDIGVLDAAARIVAELQLPFPPAGRDIVIGASVGIAFGTLGVTADELLRNADLAMYSAKRLGKGRYEIYESEMHAAVVGRLELEADLRRALARAELAVYYQPIVSLDTGLALGVEALVRWQHPERGLLMPDEFIPVAEETGLVRELGRQVLVAACTETRRWHREHPDLPQLSVSVNVSARQMQDDRLLGHVSEALEVSGLPAACLILEITETAMMQDTEAALGRFRDLKALGLRLAVDDFGIGYSSLARLESFPIDILKIDRAFIAAMDHTDGDRAPLAQAILALAQALHLDAVAEGVETQAQADALKAFGCERAQGYLFARPLTADAVDTFIQRSNTLARGSLHQLPA